VREIKQQAEGYAKKPHSKALRKTLAFIAVLVLLAIFVLVSMRVGSIDVGFERLVRGLFVSYDSDVAVVFDLRFPRILVALFGGAAMAVSGVLLQAVMKNPLADPTIIGISGGAAFAAVLIAAFMPMFYFFTPIASFIGGLLAFCLVYALSWQSGFSPVRIILVGVAVSMLFTGLISLLNVVTGSTFSGVANIVNANISMKTWDDVRLLACYVTVGLIAAIILAGRCNLIQLEDQTVRALGINVNKSRLLISLVAVMLAAISTSIIGVVAFLGLVVPHVGRLIVGSDHRVLLPFSIPLGAFTLLLADTIGRTIVAPYEVSAQIIMVVVGGIFFIVLLRRSGKVYGK
jgi:iron complex transport system permease protein